MPQDVTPTAEEIWRNQKKKYDDEERDRLADEAKKRADKDAEKDDDVLKKRAEKKQLLVSLIPKEEDLKKLIFSGISESSTGEYAYAVDQQVFNVSDKTSLTFGLNSTKKFVLGDNTSITLLNGLNLDVNLSINIDSPTKKSQDKARVSFTGIAKSLTVGATDVAQMDLDSVHPNQVVMPDLNNLHLSYGNINTVGSERLLGVEFLRKEDKSFGVIGLDECSYANFRLVTKGKIKWEDLEDIPLLDGLTSADHENIEKYIKNTGNLFEGIGKVDLPDSLENDPGLTPGLIGTNIVQYTRGIGRIAYEKMDGISKSVTYAKDQYSNTYCKAAKFTVVCSPYSTEALYMVNSTNNHVRVFNTSVTMVGVDLSSTVQGVKITPSVIYYDMSAVAGVKAKIHNGTEIEKNAGIKFNDSVIEIATKLYASEESQIKLRKAALFMNLAEFSLDEHDAAISRGGVHINQVGSSVSGAKVNIHL